MFRSFISVAFGSWGIAGTIYSDKVDQRQWLNSLGSLLFALDAGYLICAGVAVVRQFFTLEE